MFDFAWSEIALIGAVALIAIGPKDMPAAIRTVSSMIKKARRMAAEFQTHVDEMVREADLGDVKKAFTDIRNLNIPSMLEKHIDPDRSIRSTFAEDPFKPTYPVAEPASADVAVLPEPEVTAVPEEPPCPEKPPVPAWVPPRLVPPEPVEAVFTVLPDAPAFIPPDAVLQQDAIMKANRGKT